MIMDSGKSTKMFTDEEAKVYDRQIRLWGIQAQQQIRSADIFLAGLNGLATEVVKNLVLTGINSITLMDDEPVNEFDMLSNLFTRNQIGMKRAEACQKTVLELNPLVKVNIKSGRLLGWLSRDENGAKEFLKSFHVVLLVNHDLPSATLLNQYCNELKIPFFFAGAWGHLSMFFMDLGPDHQNQKSVTLKQALETKNITLESGRPALTNRETKKLLNLKSIFLSILTLFRFYDKTGKFPMPGDEDDLTQVIDSLKTLEGEVVAELDMSWMCLTDWHAKIFGEFTFISSIVGGFMAQEVIRSVTKDAINYNLFLFYEINGYNINIGI